MRETQCQVGPLPANVAHCITRYSSVTLSPRPHSHWPTIAPAVDDFFVNGLVAGVIPICLLRAQHVESTRVTAVPRLRAAKRRPASADWGSFSGHKTTSLCCLTRGTTKPRNYETHRNTKHTKSTDFVCGTADQSRRRSVSVSPQSEFGRRTSIAGTAPRAGNAAERISCTS